MLTTPAVGPRCDRPAVTDYPQVCDLCVINRAGQRNSAATPSANTAR